jgi:hypothetical protein
VTASALSPVQVFVVSTGRSGTLTLARLLDSVPGAAVDHEREPRLVAESVAYLEGQLPHAEMVDLLRRTRSPRAIGGERLSGEAHHRLSFVLPALAEAFPEARIVWLLRDGRPTVASLHHRGWYEPNEAELRGPHKKVPWHENRVRGDLAGDLSPEEWAALDGFGRCCWYWSFANRLIQRDLGRLGLRALKLRLEELDRRRPELEAFLGLRAELPAARVEHRSKTPPIGWRLWSAERRQTFERVCGETMDEHYPGWREDLERGLAGGVAALLGRTAVQSARTARARGRRWRVV